MSQISLTAPMRSNLLSLQNIARQQDIVQNRLATGLKVSSAIDNPSSYYTAASLSNRAADLTALLDAMSQGVQTIQTASEAIDSATSFLEQAKATANQALESAEPIVAKVFTKEELLAAIASGKQGLIVLENDIDLGATDLTLADNQSLVGKSYLAASEEAVKLKAGNIYVGDNAKVQNLAIEANRLYVQNKQNVLLSNLDLNAMVTLVSSDAKVAGNINISSSQYAFYVGENSNLTFLSGSVVNSRAASRTIELIHANCTVEEGAIINAQTNRSGVEIISLRSNSQLDVYGTINGNAEQAGFVWLYGNNGSNNSLNIYKTAQLYCEHPSGTSFVPISGTGTQSIFFESGAKLGFKQDTNIKFYQTLQDFDWQNKSLTAAVFAANSQYFGETNDTWGYDFTDFATSVPQKVNNRDAAKTSPEANEKSAQYALILEQFDMLISDASYKGINLLQGQNLQINFNEDRSSMIEVPGYDVDSESLGLKTKEWLTQEDIEKSISELENAICSLRSFASAFGNYYSIVTTRQDFTENLINVLEEGADKLTLADMNEESANMLALQTSQQLAINSLSLASQAAQSVLKLF